MTKINKQLLNKIESGKNSSRDYNCNRCNGSLNCNINLSTLIQKSPQNCLDWSTGKYRASLQMVLQIKYLCILSEHMNLNHAIFKLKHLFTGFFIVFMFITVIRDHFIQWRNVPVGNWTKA